MEVVKKTKGRPRVLTDEQRKRNKTRYQLTKEWICPICSPSKNYSIAGKSQHIKTKKHQKIGQKCEVVISITPEGEVKKEVM